jgi:hypothetical protein
MAKVTGVGGVFFKSRGDNAALAAWYQKHLGMPLEDFGGAILKWPDDRAEDGGPHCVAYRRPTPPPEELKPTKPGTLRCFAA